MAELSPAWVRSTWYPKHQNTLTHSLTVDLGGSLAVASRGLFATGVSTDLNVTYLSSGGKVGDVVKAEVSCDKCMFTTSPSMSLSPFSLHSLLFSHFLSPPSLPRLYSSFPHPSQLPHQTNPSPSRQSAKPSPTPPSSSRTRPTRFSRAEATPSTSPSRGRTLRISRTSCRLSLSRGRKVWRRRLSLAHRMAKSRRGSISCLMCRLKFL